MQKPASTAVIGIFDSGVGGLSVLRALLGEIHNAHFVYVADHGFAPYGEQSADYIIERAQTISDFLLETFPLCLLVVACNTATAAAVKSLRSRHLRLPVVGIEPAIKPAAQQSKYGRVGIMATPGTLASAAFLSLRARLEAQHPKVYFQSVACTSLAKAIEDSFVSGNTCAAKALAKRYLNTLHNIDTLVLGCTHYPFLQCFLQNTLGSKVLILEPSLPVARQSKRLLKTHPLLSANTLSANKAEGFQSANNTCTFFSSGDTALLQAACCSWLGIETISHKL